MTQTGGVGRSIRTDTGPLAPGQTFGTRYHIIRLLGVGGMGAVYQAWDEELGVAVAIKVIRPEVAADPAAAADLQRRFKRELLLARQVTHRNVVRIHDLGEIDGIKYITMPFIQGQDTATLLRTVGRLPVSNSLSLAKQIVAGLQAAHEAGVVHRDLKPANIMVEEERAVIMDFGIARAAGSGGSTVLGTVVGTLEYMAPEQARGEAVDHRVDLYALGLILYDMLVGRRHAARPDSVVAELMARMQNAPPSPRTIDPQIPEAVDRIVNRCLQPNPADRPQTATELLAELESLDIDGHPLAGRTLAAATIPVAPAPAPRRRLLWVVAAPLVLLFGAGVAATLLWDRNGSAPAAPVAVDPVSLAIVPFHNSSNDPTLNWVGNGIAEMLHAEMGQSQYLTLISATRVHGLLRDLQFASGEPLNPSQVKQLADLSRAETIVWGQYTKYGSGIQFTATLEDARTQRPVELRASAVNEQALMTAVADLASQIRSKLALSSDVVKELEATAFKPTLPRSAVALRHYNEGLAFARSGRHAAAVKQFTASIEAEPTFALSHAQLAQAYHTLNLPEDGRRASEKALELSGNLTTREQAMVQATHAQIRNDAKAALTAYQNLLKVAPEDSDVHLTLASLYEGTGAYNDAATHVAKVLQKDPNHLDALNLAGRVEIRRRQWQEALKHLNPALTLATQLGNEEARANSLHSIGTVYKRMNRPKDALDNYQLALKIKQVLGHKGSIASTLNEIGQVQGTLGNGTEALKNYEEALRLRREVDDTRGIGSSLIDLGIFHASRGDYDSALTHYRDSLKIQRQLGNKDYEAMCLTQIGQIHLIQGRFEEARTNFELSLSLREKSNVPSEIATNLHHLGETASKMGRYNEAVDFYLRSLEQWRKMNERRNEAMGRHYLATVFEYQGRYGAALKAREDALKSLRELKDQSPILAGVLSGYGLSLGHVGRIDEGRTHLDEALKLARSLKHESLVAQTLSYQGELAYYQGDLAAARRLFEEALPIAQKRKAPHLVLFAELGSMKVAVAEGRLRSAPAAFKKTGAQAEAVGLRHLAVESSLLAGESLLAAKSAAAAIRELEAAADESDQLGLEVLSARSHAALAQALRATGKTAEASTHASRARQTLDRVRKETAPADPLKRADLARLRASLE